MLSVRGYQKRVIYLKNTGSPLFDEAYFIVSREGEATGLAGGDMVYEANRIIDESLDGERVGGRRNVLRRILSFALPFLLGAVISTVVCIIVVSVL